MTIEKALTDYLGWRLSIGSEFISTHEMEHARDWIQEKYNKLHTIDSYNREWRRLRATGVIRTKIVTLPGKRETTWKILELFPGPQQKNTLRLR
jgi:hypothetical protein|tara:strand:- start:2976 stop:3257 length:282 start_codon:yes stop_codon:yes gene_type:complete